MKSRPKTLKPQRPAAKKSASGSNPRPLGSAALLKLAARNRPPQAWYDEATDPFKPKA